MDVSEIIEGLSSNEKRLLITLSGMKDESSAQQVFETGDFSQMVEVMNAASWLESKGLLNLRESVKKFYSLSGPEDEPDKLPERQALDLLEERGGSISIEEMQQEMDGNEASISIGWLKRKGLADIIQTDSGNLLTITREGEKALVEKMEDEKLLEEMKGGMISADDAPQEIIDQLLSRKDFISEKLVRERFLSLTEQGCEVLNRGIEIREEIAQLTPEMIQTGEWREAEFRKYDVNTFAPSVYPGKKHPLMRIAEEVRRIFVQMGFQEIDEEYIQPAFWNMDALFTPQDHPARDLQDTFYLEKPSVIRLEDEEIVQRVKKIHEDGGDTGSTGWQYEWSREEAERALLRTHTTVNTIRYLWKNPEPPVKVFSLSRIFRKEAIDSTHLPEFVQIEGIIMEEEANFDMLVSVLKEFYGQMGFDTIRVRPGYFPYTEPSLEIEVLFNGSWMELGGAGVFRPEVTAPFGVEYPVLAWGLGFERLAMLRWDISDIRDLYVSDIDMLRRSPLL